MNTRAALFLMVLAAALALPLPAAPAPAVAAPVEIPTAAEAVGLALRESPQAAIARAQLEAALAASVNLESMLLGWRFDAVLDDTLSRSEQLAPVLGGDPLNTFSATVAARKALAVRGSTALALEEARLQREQAERDYLARLREIGVTAYEAYRQLELALIRHRILERAVALTRDSLEAAEEQAVLGAHTEAQVRAARLAHEEAVQRRDASRRLLDIAWQRLARLLGLDPAGVDILDLDVIEVEEALEMIAGRHPAFWPERAVPWQESLEELVERAKANRPEVQNARAGVALARLGVEKVKLDRRPDIQLTAGATWPGQIRASLTVDDEGVAQASVTGWRFDRAIPSELSAVTQAPKDEVDWSLGIRVTYNLWDSGASRAAAHRAGQLLRQAELGLDEALHGVALDVEGRHAELVSAYEALLMASERALLAHLELETEEAKAALGMSSRLQVDAAAMQLWQAVAAAVSARFDYELAVVRLAAAAAWDLETLSQIVHGLQGW